jgi:hypothetical protein
LLSDAEPGSLSDVQFGVERRTLQKPLHIMGRVLAGVELYMTRAARKGANGVIYAPFRDLRTGRMVWKTPREVADLAFTFPGSMTGSA